MASELERIYTIPLRDAHHGKRSKRADRAVRAVRSFLVRHMKSDNVWLSEEVNETIWARGKYTIPSKIRVRATRFTDGVVEVTLPDTETVGSIREAIQERQEKAAETPVLQPFAGEEEHTHDAPVTDITGIGPATAEKLEKLNIKTTHDLAHADVAAVAEVLGKTVEQVQPWIDEAHELNPHDDSEE